MGFTVAGLVGSPRKGMNTDTLVTKALEGASSAGASVEKVYLNDLSIRPCQACSSPPSEGFCTYRDGMDTIYRLLGAADAFVVGSPAYFDGISAQLKLVIDRSNCLTEMTAGTDGKVTFRRKIARIRPGVFFWVADLSRNPDHALSSIKLWGKDAGIQLVDTVIVVNSDRGVPARERSDLLVRAFNAGKSLVTGEPVVKSS